MTAKELLRELVDGLSEEEARRLLFLYESDEEEFTPEEIEEILQAREEMERGELVTQEEFEAYVRR